MSSTPSTDPATPDLAAIQGVRPGTSSHSSAFVRSDERMDRAVLAMDSISRTVVRTVEGPRGLLEEVARAASAHLGAPWTLLALSDGQLAGAHPRFLAVDHRGDITTDVDQLPTQVRDELTAIRSGRVRPRVRPGRWVRVTMTLEGRRVGSLAAVDAVEDPPEAADLAVLRILANQAAVALHTSEQHQASLSLHRQAQRLHDDALTQARDLAQRNAQLQDAEHRLTLLAQRELIDAERHRIARELHDTVAQYVLSAGMAVELARGDAARLDTPEGVRITERLEMAKRLSAEATNQLRSSIYALHQHTGDTLVALPDLLRQVLEHHRHHLDISVCVEGDEIPLPDAAHHEIARAVGEAVFNVTSHADARRANVRVRYHPERLLVTIADDGSGDPVRLSRLLRLERGGSPDGRHRGLANMESRMADLGGSIAFRRARLGGVRVELRIPLPIAFHRPSAPLAAPLGPRPPAPRPELLPTLRTTRSQEDPWPR